MNTKMDMQNCSMIIYLIGKPGVGKYTIAKALSKHGFILCDNQLINNPVFELLQYDGYTKIPDFAWDTISRIREVIFDFISMTKTNNYVLTNCLFEDEGDRRLYTQVKQMAAHRGSVFIPVKLCITEEEHLRRVTQPERRVRWKSIDHREVYDQRPLLKIKDLHLLELDVSNLSPQAAAEQILAHIRKLAL
jgi:predicted ATPase